MKIETWLSPNCSEATFVVVDWNKQQILETFSEQSESTDPDSLAEFVKACYCHLKDGRDVTSGNNDGNRFHPAILDALKEAVDTGVILNVDDDKNMEALGEALYKDESEDYSNIILKHAKSKVELLAEGYYGGKKKCARTPAKSSK